MVGHVSGGPETKGFSGGGYAHICTPIGRAREKRSVIFDGLRSFLTDARLFSDDCFLLTVTRILSHGHAATPPIQMTFFYMKKSQKWTKNHYFLKNFRRFAPKK